MNSQYVVFISTFVVASLAGLASLFRSGELINRRNILTYALNSGILGLSVALLWYKKFIEDVYFLVGLAIVAGLTGVKGVDLAIEMLKKALGKFSGLEEKESKENKEIK